MGQVFGALTAGALAGAAGLVVTFWAFAAIAVVAALISPRVEYPRQQHRLGLSVADGDYSPECVEVEFSEVRTG